MRLGIGLGLTSGASPVEAPALDLSAPVAQSVPLWSDTAPAAGDTVTITKGTYVGIPIPDIAGTLTLDGVDVIADMVGGAYTIPEGTAADAEIVWSETATNAVGSAAAQTVTATVADLTAPTGTFSAGAQSDGDLPLTLTALTEDVTATFVVVPAGDETPTAAEIDAEEASGGDASVDSGSFSATAPSGSTDLDIVDGLDGEYDIHLVLRDAAGNLSPVYTEENMALNTMTGVSFADAIAGGDDPVASVDFNSSLSTTTLYGQDFIDTGTVVFIDTLNGAAPGMLQATKDALHAAGSFVAIYDTTNTGFTTTIQANIQGQTLAITVKRNSANGVVDVDVDADTGGVVDVSALYGQSAGTIFRFYVAWTQTAATRVYHGFNRFNQAGDRYRNCTVFQRTRFDADNAIMATEIAGMAI